MGVLEDVKSMLGVEPSVDEFDTDILAHINSACVSLSQAGVVPAGVVVDKDTEWSALVSDPKFASIKTYLTLFVRRVFDPPTTSFVTTSLKESLDEMLWRLIEQKEYNG